MFLGAVSGAVAGAVVGVKGAVSSADVLAVVVVGTAALVLAEEVVDDISATTFRCRVIMIFLLRVSTSDMKNNLGAQAVITDRLKE